MPCYEYRCRSCGTTFEMRRPMSEAGAAATCPAGHEDTVKLLSTISVTGISGAGSAPAPMGPACGMGAGGGCCGGGGCGG